MTKKAFIPASTRELLKDSWVDKTGNTDNVVNNHRNGPHDVSAYLFWDGADDVNTSSIAFSFAEAKALHQEGAFGDGSELLHVENSQWCVKVNEHASHSLQEFLSDVTIAWNAHKERLNKYGC